MKIKLQLDTTVLYAMGWRIRAGSHQLPSPYTYRTRPPPGRSTTLNTLSAPLPGPRQLAVLLTINSVSGKTLVFTNARLQRRGRQVRLQGRGHRFPHGSG
jgi:hypothetical protein